MSTLSTAVRRVVWSKRLFEFWQRLGVNITKKHFSSPIPDTKELKQREDLWTEELPLAGIDMNTEGQLNFLENIFPRYKSELNFPVEKTSDPHQFYLNNAGFGLEDAGVFHCMVRHFKPKIVIEVGAGNSTLISTKACLLNEKDGLGGKVIAVEPYPREYLERPFPGFDRLVIKKAEDMNAGFFERLNENDILFIDSSHVLRIGNDVNFLFLDVLPRLKKGVVIHIHDIFFPYHYPRKNIIENRSFWTEQYILQAFLCQNDFYEVLFGNYCMLSKYPDKMWSVFKRPPGCRPHGMSSFWIRKIK